MTIREKLESANELNQELTPKTVNLLDQALCDTLRLTINDKGNSPTRTEVANLSNEVI